MRTKYPRTLHIPGSPGATSDDKVLRSMDHLIGRRVVVTEKMDGENTTLYRDGLHARSLDGRSHPSQDWVRGLQGRIGYQIPQECRICGENVYAEHSIHYDSLPDYFLAFSWWEGDVCLDWETTVERCAQISLQTVPVIWSGVLGPEMRFDQQRGLCGGLQEGYVIRLAERFTLDQFGQSVAKWVRPNHVQTDQHWSLRPVTPNGVCYE